MPEKLSAGNRESAKEALAILRFVGGWAMSIIIVLGGLWARGFLLMPQSVFWLAIVILLISFFATCLGTMYTVSLLYQEKSAIIEHKAVRVPGIVSIFTFIFGILLIFIGLNMEAGAPILSEIPQQ
ncbi:MAG: hypothetical protein KI789_01480 [Hoeflea sp.]|nr:hypothetical protein [Hoeflea sp.]